MNTTTTTTDTFDLNGVRVPKTKRRKSPGQPQDNPFRSFAVAPFTIICDTREQLPYEFSGIEDNAGNAIIVPTVVEGLASGDYSIVGLTDQVAVERKSMDDLFGSVTWGRDRFEREIARLNDMPGFACVMIEATWPEIMSPLEYRPGWVNQTDPRSVEGTITAWSIRYPRCHWWAAGSRRDAELRTFSILRKFWMEMNEKKSTKTANP